MNKPEDIFFMREAIKEAKKAMALDEVPIGAVIVKNGNIIARGHNLKEGGKDATLHGEIIAIREACRALGGWRLPGTTLYVNLEPCPMCAGAMLQARIGRLVYGAQDSKSGAVKSVINLLDCDAFNHKIEFTEGILAEETSRLLKEFFRKKRGIKPKEENSEENSEENK